MGFGGSNLSLLPPAKAASSATDPNDFSERYNTELSSEDESRFQEWARKENRAGDVYDYDLRGAWKELQSGDMEEDARGHLGDKYKKPNHPTFSDQSQYNGVDGYVGGAWSEEGGKTVYRVAKGNLLSKTQLARYFARAEPDVVLVDER